MLKSSIDTAIVRSSELISGELSISGYKHCATVIIAASLIADWLTVKLTNVPNIDDIKYLSQIINNLGGFSKYDSSNKTLSISSPYLRSHKIPKQYSQYIHGAIYLLPVILGRFKKVELGNCGGCQLGEKTILGKRPIEHMLSILERFGAKFRYKNGKIVGKISDFSSCHIDIMDYSDRQDTLTGPFVSGATKTAILAAAFVKKGTTKIFNPYLKPDVTELLKFLKRLGYKIHSTNTSIEISPFSEYQAKIKFNLISDLSQIMTFITVSVYNNLPLTLTNITTRSVRKGLKTELLYMEKMGVKLHFEKSSIDIKKCIKLKSLDITVTSTSIYSDHQPFFSLILLNATGNSKITEYVWKNRFSYVNELKKLGFLLKVKNNVLTIIPSQLNPENHFLHAADLRSAATLIIASLKSPTPITIKGIHHLKRGYDNFIENLISLGAKIDLVDHNNF